MTTSACWCCGKINQFCRCDERHSCTACRKCPMHCDCKTPKLAPTLDRESAEPKGERSICRDSNCRAVIYWQVTAKGKRTPVNQDNTPHWSTCPGAKSFKRKVQR